MRIKENKGKTKELVFLISASILTLLLILYFLWLVRHLVQKADDVFDFSHTNNENIPTFNFARYEKLFGPIKTAPSTAVSSTTTATSTKK